MADRMRQMTSRRQFLASAGAASLLGTAGCLSGAVALLAARFEPPA
jgi:hypothetical protein